MEPFATVEMCAYCFEVLINQFDGGESPAPPFDLSFSCPLFVTLKILSPSGPTLRGCIGTLSPKHISCLSEYAILSAFRDRRFQPLKKHEVINLLRSYFYYSFTPSLPVVFAWGWNIFACKIWGCERSSRLECRLSACQSVAMFYKYLFRLELMG